MAFADEIIRSLHDPALYREASSRSALRGLLQLGRLALLSALCATVAATLWLSSMWREHVAPVLDAVPTIVIRGGEARVEGPEPWERRVVRDHLGNDWVVLLDTRSPSPGFPRAQGGVMLARTELRFKFPGAPTHALPLARAPDMKLGPHALRRAVFLRLMLVPPALLGITLLWFLLTKAVQVGILVLWLGRFRVGASKRARFNLAAHALTAAVLVDCLSWWLPVPPMLSGPLYVALAVFYTAAGARQLPDPPV